MTRRENTENVRGLSFSLDDLWPSVGFRPSFSVWSSLWIKVWKCLLLAVPSVVVLRIVSCSAFRRNLALPCAASGGASGEACPSAGFDWIERIELLSVRNKVLKGWVFCGTSALCVYWLQADAWIPSCGVILGSRFHWWLFAWRTQRKGSWMSSRSCVVEARNIQPGTRRTLDDQRSRPGCIHWCCDSERCSILLDDLFRIWGQSVVIDLGHA